MERIFWKTLLVISVFVVSEKGHAYDFKVDGICYNVLSFSDLTCEVTSSPDGYSGTIVIPSKVEYNGRQVFVTRVGEKAFAECSIEEFHLPPSVKSIGWNAFYKCNVKRVFIEELRNWLELEFDGVNSTDSPFENSRLIVKEGSNLFINGKICERVIIPDGISIIRECAFRNVESLKEVIIPEGVQKISDYAFSNCPKLVKANIPLTCKTLGYSCFYKDYSLSKNLSISTAVDSIGSYAFYGCELDSIYVAPKDAEIILGEKCFGTKILNLQRNFSANPRIDNPSNFSSTIEKLIIGPNISFIPYYAFRNCDSLKKFIVEDGSTQLIIKYKEYSYYNGLGTWIKDEKLAFENVHLEDIYIGRSLYCGSSWGAFPYSRSSMKSITIGDAVKEMGIALSGYFYFDNLSYISFGENIAEITDMSNTNPAVIVSRNVNPPLAKSFCSDTYLHSKLYVPVGSKERYQNADVWKNFWNIIEADDDFLTGFDIVTDKTTNSKEKNQYTIGGIKTKHLQRGINIIQESDGTTKKIFVK